MADYFIGTAGWSYNDWEGIVYPQKKVRGFHALIFLAHYINIIEINSTFYRPPALHISLSWIKKVEHYPDFLFAVKLHQIFTHKRKGFTQKDVDNFKLGIEPLRANERLASILIQFPWSFASTISNNEYLINLFKFFSDYPLTLEVRHSSWNSNSFYKLLSEYNVSFCNIDQPIFRNSIKPGAVSTNSEFSYVRLHGRNYKNWFKQDAGRDERYNYLYTKEELQDWIERIKDLGNQSSKVFVITNNHYRGQALANALQIKNMITGEKLDIPPLLVEQYPVLKELEKKIKEGQFGLFDEK
ncbi:hypothetical protein LCGC14_1438590 [marine sediment metagenome]|uniref:DUF72 domain-containing protein n=1 Tax=marine sediment metagenome TaxID=412755 RepID=A0A0F9K7K0_9ZZZZ|nr:DUF72 domain-containing protein [Candidatus Aminicenantes bacterium]HEB34965.1 DUF72 domain-containing protein [Candidatus Aminicenantes bacterium]